MEVSLGVRCHKDGLAYVVLRGDTANPTKVEDGFCRIPSFAARAEELHWVRNEVREIIDRCSPDHFCLKGPETIAKSKDLGRAEVEGVVQEAAFSAGLAPVRRVKSQLRAALGLTEPARYVERALTPANLTNLPKNRHEAALAALSALPHA